MAQKDKLREALELFGKEYIEELGRQLKAKGKDATGDLLRSLESKVITTGFGTSYTLLIKGEDYLKYVDKGRKPGKQPPLRAIQKWVRIRGINPAAAFPIARSIGENGIRPTNVIENSFRKVNSDRNIRLLNDGYADWIDEMIDQLVLNISKNSNITVK